MVLPETSIDAGFGSEGPVPLLHRTTEHEVERARAELAEQARRVGTGLTVTPVVITANSAERGIVDYARSVGADYIAMSSHGRRGLRRFILGSTAEAVLRHTRIPTIIYPPAS
jgi:nucleotide-binding universal stress UspA family protein